MNRNILIGFLFFLLLQGCSNKIQQQGNKKLTSGNPVFQGWYADPEGAIFNDRYWIYPTYSAPYNEQVFLMLFLHTTLLTGINIAG